MNKLSPAVFSFAVIFLSLFFVDQVLVTPSAGRGYVTCGGETGGQGSCTGEKDCDTCHLVSVGMSPISYFCAKCENGKTFKYCGPGSDPCADDAKSYDCGKLFLHAAASQGDACNSCPGNGSLAVDPCSRNGCQ